MNIKIIDTTPLPLLEQPVYPESIYIKRVFASQYQKGGIPASTANPRQFQDCNRFRWQLADIRPT